MSMTIGEKLLTLSAEYSDAVAQTDVAYFGGVTKLREPAVIAAEYEAELRSVRTS